LVENSPAETATPLAVPLQKLPWRSRRDAGADEGRKEPSIGSHFPTLNAVSPDSSKVRKEGQIDYEQPPQPRNISGGSLEPGELRQDRTGRL